FFSHPHPTPAPSPLSLHDALPICANLPAFARGRVEVEHEIALFDDLVEATTDIVDIGGSGGVPRDCLVTGGAEDPEYAHTSPPRSEEHTSELQSRFDLVCRLLLEK